MLKTEEQPAAVTSRLHHRAGQAQTNELPQSGHPLSAGLKGESVVDFDVPQHRCRCHDGRNTPPNSVSVDQLRFISAGNRRRLHQRWRGKKPRSIIGIQIATASPTVAFIKDVLAVSR